jgi:anti-sigma factor RsiW
MSGTMTCDAARELLHPYLDGELDRAAVGEIEAHLAGCAACRSELASLEQLRASIRQAPRYQAPRALREQLRSLHELATPAQQPARSVTTPWRWSMAAALLVAFGLGSTVTWWRMADLSVANHEQAFANELLTSHLRALAATSPVDVISEDRHTVKPWFAGRIGESPPVVDLSEQGFPLVGGRIDYVGGQRTAVVVYRHRQHVIDVYMTPVSREGGAPRPIQLQGYWLTSCRIGDRSAWMVSDTEQAQLLRLCELIAREDASARAP